MMKNFTQKIKLCVLLLAGCNSIISAQSFMVVNSPAGVAGEYVVVRGTAGDVTTETLTGDLQLGNDGMGISLTDGCEALDAATGKVLMIDRGNCPFVDKLGFAATTGAIAVLFCNNSGDAPISVGGNVPSLTVPVYMATQSDCATIKVAMESGIVNVTFEKRAFECERTYDAEVFWGNVPGQGDFSVPFEQSQWETVNVVPLDRDDVIWERSLDGTQIFPSFCGSGYITESPTFCDGVASFSSVKHAIGDNPNPTQPYTSYSAELISPSIDCSGKNNVVLEFYQVYFNLGTDASTVWASADDGAWIEIGQLSTDNPQCSSATSSTPITEKVRFPAIPCNNSSNCKVKITASQTFYFTAIDDVTLRDEAINDLKINAFGDNGWVASAPNYLSPTDFVDEMAFLLDISNIGNTVIENAKVTVEVLNPSNAVVHSQELLYGNIDPSATIQNRYFAETYKPSDGDGEYTVRYTVSGDNENTPNNNVYSSKFKLGGNIFSKTPLTNLSGWRRGTGDFFSYGNYYHFPKDKWDDGQLVVIDKVRGGISSNETESAGLAVAIVYQWIDDNMNGIMEEDERVPLATSSSVPIINASLSDDIEFDLFDVNNEDEKYVLNIGENKGIVVMIHFENIDATGEWFYPSLNTSDFPQYNIYATNMAFDSLGIVRGSGMWADRSSREYEATPFARDASLAWFAPLYLDMVLNTNDEFNQSIKLTTYPNPTSDMLNVDFAYDNIIETATIKLINSEGKIVDAKRYVNVLSKNLTFNVSKLPSGIYSVIVDTEKGFNSKKILIQR